MLNYHNFSEVTMNLNLYEVTMNLMKSRSLFTDHNTFNCYFIYLLYTLATLVAFLQGGRDVYEQIV